VDQIKQAWQRLPSVVRTTAFSAARAFLGAIVVLLPGIWAAPDFGTAKTLAVAAVIAGGTAAVRVVQHIIQGSIAE
jgi:orotidine-5'-phosphate decarboxylase